MDDVNHSYIAEFLSTPSARRATSVTWNPIHQPTDFYPRPPRGGRRDRFIATGVRWAISIHALREEGDPPLLG